MANSLLDYRGDVGLGGGSNPDIGVPGPNENFNQINKTLENILLIDADRNTKKWQQSIKDRDQVNQLIADGQVSVGAASPEDRKLIDAQQAIVEKTFLDNPDILYNPKAFAKYTEERGKLQDIANQAQMRWKGLADLKAQKANNPYPWEQEDIQKHIDAQSKKGFWDTIDPYQKTFDIDMQGILGYARPLQRSNVDTKNPLKSFNETYYDFPSIFNAAKNDFIAGGKSGYNQTAFFNKIQALQPQQLAQFVDSTNAQIKKYNDERGFVPGSQGYVQPVQAHHDEKSGQIILQETAPDLAAKTALAAQSQFSVKTSAFKAEDLLKHQEEEQKIGIERDRATNEATKLGLEGDRAKAYTAYLKAKTTQIGKGNQQQTTDVAKQMQSYWDNLGQSEETQGSFLGMGGKKVKGAPIVYMGNLPPAYRFISGPIVNDKGKVTVGEIKPFDADEDNPYYKTKYVDPKTGQDYTDMLKSKYDASIKNGYTGSYTDYLKELKSKNQIELVLQGENGSATEASIYSSVKTIAEQGGKKGEENITNPDEQGDQ